MSSIQVKRAFGGLIQVFKITYVMEDITPEVGVHHYFEHFIKGLLHAARRKLSCFKFYVTCEGVFQVIVLKYLTFFSNFFESQSINTS